MPIYRIRKRWGVKGGGNHYSHADVISRNHHAALRAAKEGRIHNWRRIDTFDISSEDYRDFELLGRIDRAGAKNPMTPTPIRLHTRICRLEEKILAMDGVDGCSVGPGHSTVLLARRSLKLRAAIRHLVDSKFGPIRFLDP